MHFKDIFKFKEVEIIDLCSGGGMTALALKKFFNRLGIKVTIKAIGEIDKKSIEAYKALHGDNIINLGDVAKAKFDGMKCTILLFTFPCQSLSIAGKQKGMKEGSGTTSSLVWNLPRILDEMEEMPPFLFMENVKNLLGKKNIDEFMKLKSALEDRGYKVFYDILDAQKFGNVPQHRERAYIICTRLPFDFTYSFPREIELTKTFSDILETNVSEEHYVNDMETKINKCIARGRTYRVFNPDKAKVAYTITTNPGYRNSDNYVFDCDVNEEECIHFSPKNDELMDLDAYKQCPIRRLTRLELGRLMGMEDEDIHKLDFLSKTRFGKIMGNGIVVPVVERIFEALYEQYEQQLELLNLLQKVESEHWGQPDWNDRRLVSRVEDAIRRPIHPTKGRTAFIKKRKAKGVYQLQLGDMSNDVPGLGEKNHSPPIMDYEFAKMV